jgi:hypothetical protein
MKPLIVVASCVALVGCAAPIKWYRADATEQQLIQDRAYCAFEAEKSTASYGPGPRAYSVADAIAQGIGQGLEIAARQQSIFKLCMQARGYVPIQGSAPGTGYVERPAGEGVIVHSRLEPGPLDRTPPAVVPTSLSSPSTGDAYSRMNRKIEAEPPAPPKVGKFTYEANSSPRPNAAPPRRPSP